MGYYCYGWDFGSIGGVISLPSFQEYFGLDKQSDGVRANLSGNIVSVFVAGSFFGALTASYFSSRFGRKPYLLASAIIHMLGCLVQAIVGIGSSEVAGLKVLYFGRFLAGIGIGIVTALVPPYVSEGVPRAIRGRCTAYLELAFSIGSMLSYWVNYSASKNIPPGQMQWRLPIIMQMAPNAFFLILLIFQPESPRFLVECGRYDEAAKVLAYISRKPVDDGSVIATLNEIKADFEGKQRLPLLDQFRKMGESQITALLCFIPSLLMTFQQWTGTNAINYYSPQIFATLGISGTTSGLFATGVYGIVKVVSISLVLLFAVERMGRKRCLIYGGLGQGLVMLWIAGYSGVHPQKTIVPASYVSIVAVYLFAVSFSIGWGPVPLVVASEVAPNHLRAAVMSLAAACTSLFTFVVAQLTPILLSHITYGTFLLYGICSLVAAFWAYVFLPETTGYALEDVKYLFHQDIMVRSLYDAPAGHIFLRGKHPISVPELKNLTRYRLNAPSGTVVGGQDSEEKYIEEVMTIPYHTSRKTDII
ncbi:hypothetical protein SERLA73DRAFT_54552 [Serpula lacrymans var. lacrymans S7.3]|uniref:Major facilitator superfamily (MFS) profile domain-containing protein n=2 Tax=Serpula lacrymans var. lacrymans TaxID=341189 RepID=F8PXF1_SERL3|nr:uncharacterized protein SERLADRAFT_348934 [Serpula lacrymans var. lacrymans S7.9]EGN99477.1 hypothetical protein SERLA73DRAFT_54552 [Serpula lacrymans var. lacrymans S7.3]EGO25033.1 hypothetical protein SERLADRAFT_348934 [Serpula lacrymans var. lacrymans S7.9]